MGRGPDQGARSAGAAVGALSLLVFAAAGAARAEPSPRFDHGQDEAHARGCDGCHRVLNPRTYEVAKPCAKPLHFKPCQGCHEHEAEVNRGLVQSVRRRSPARAELCSSCHRGPRTNAVVYPPFRARGESSFTLARFDHGLHAQEEEASCEGCHGDPAEADRVEPHAGCVDCHLVEQEPRMAQCAGCHVLEEATSSLFAVPDRLRAHAFGHRSHSEEAPDAQCTDCHRSLAPAKGSPVGRPKKADCEGCHDGAAAFGVTGTECGRCHAPPESSR